MQEMFSIQMTKKIQPNNYQNVRNIFDKFSENMNQLQKYLNCTSKLLVSRTCHTWIFATLPLGKERKA